MTRLRKGLLIGAGIVLILVLAAPMLWTLFLGWLLDLHTVPSKIVDFRPSSFEAEANGKFFYSIGNELKYSNRIDPNAPTLFRGQVWNSLVSPDNKKIALVADGRLVVVSSDAKLWQVTAVNSSIREPKPVGEQFFRDDDFQWSRDSNTIYLKKDEYQQSQEEDSNDRHARYEFVSKEELWKYDLGTGTLQLVLKPFPAFQFFCSKGDGIYFSAVTDSGDSQLRYFDGKHIKDIAEPNAHDIPPGRLSARFVESPFYSFSIVDYERNLLPSKGVELISGTYSGQPSGPQRLLIHGQTYLTVTRGTDWQGNYRYCSDLVKSVFLPGDRYFLFNLPSCQNYRGQLLFDVTTGKYEQLPADTVVYLTLNTDTYPNYRIDSSGIVIK